MEVAHRDFDNIKNLLEEFAAWLNAVSSLQKGVDWKMEIEDARIKHFHIS